MSVVAASDSSPLKGGRKGRPFRHKRRGWLFKVEGVNHNGVTGAEILALVRHRYSTVKRLILTPTSRFASASPARGSSRTVFVEVQFTGPQPSAGCGALLRLLLGGDSVDARPVELPRGRKRKNGADPGPGPSWNVSFGVEGRAPSSQKSYRGFSGEETWPRQQQRQQQQHVVHRGQHTRFEAHDAMFGQSSPPPATQPPPAPPQPPQLDGSSVDFVRVKYDAGFGRGGRSIAPPAVSPCLERAPCSPASQTRTGASSGTGGAGSGGEGGGAMLPMEEVRVETSLKECDLEGRPFSARTNSGGAPTAVGSTDHGECYLVFTGLERTGNDLGSLNVTALFGVDRMHQVATVTSPLQVGADGRVYSQLFYPTLQEIWPHLCRTPNIRVVQVDVEVEVLSDSGREYRYLGPHLKLAYFRGHPNAVEVTLEEAPGPSAVTRLDPRSPARLYPEGSSCRHEWAHHGHQAGAAAAQKMAGAGCSPHVRRRDGTKMMTET